MVSLLSDKARRLNANILVGGDFNGGFQQNHGTYHNLHGLSQTIDLVYANSTLETNRIRMFYQQGRWCSTIDHVFVGRELQQLIMAYKVAQWLSWSHHAPIIVQICVPSVSKTKQSRNKRNARPPCRTNVNVKNGREVARFLGLLPRSEPMARFSMDADQSTESIAIQLEKVCLLICTASAARNKAGARNLLQLRLL